MDNLSLGRKSSSPSLEPLLPASDSLDSDEPKVSVSILFDRIQEKFPEETRRSLDEYAIVMKEQRGGYAKYNPAAWERLCSLVVSNQTPEKVEQFLNNLNEDFQLVTQAKGHLLDYTRGIWIEYTQDLASATLWGGGSQEANHRSLAKNFARQIAYPEDNGPMRWVADYILNGNTDILEKIINKL